MNQLSTTKLNPRFTILLLFMIAVASMRIANSAQLTPWSNFSPVGAMGLFGGAYFSSKWKAFAFPLLTLLISDLIINTFVFNGRLGIMYSGWFIIYGIFALIVFFGKTILKKVSVKNVVIAAIAAALTHWLIADFTVWLGGGTDLRTMTPLTKDFNGLLQCYAQGFPFMKNFLMGNLVYGAIMFGGFELTQQRFPKLQLHVS